VDTLCQKNVPSKIENVDKNRNSAQKSDFFWDNFTGEKVKNIMKMKNMLKQFRSKIKKKKMAKDNRKKKKIQKRK